MKLFALIIAVSAALAPMQAYASTGSDQSPVQVQKAQPQLQLAWGGDSGGGCSIEDTLIGLCVDVDL